MEDPEARPRSVCLARPALDQALLPHLAALAADAGQLGAKHRQTPAGARLAAYLVDPAAAVGPPPHPTAPGADSPRGGGTWPLRPSADEEAAASPAAGSALAALLREEEKEAAAEEAAKTSQSASLALPSWDLARSLGSVLSYNFGSGGSGGGDGTGSSSGGGGGGGSSSSGLSSSGLSRGGGDELWDPEGHEAGSPSSRVTSPQALERRLRASRPGAAAAEPEDAEEASELFEGPAMAGSGLATTSPFYRGGGGGGSSGNLAAAGLEAVGIDLMAAGLPSATRDFSALPTMPALPVNLPQGLGSNLSEDEEDGEMSLFENPGSGESF